MYDDAIEYGSVERHTVEPFFFFPPLLIPVPVPVPVFLTCNARYAAKTAERASKNMFPWDNHICAGSSITAAPRTPAPMATNFPRYIEAFIDKLTVDTPTKI